MIGGGSLNDVEFGLETGGKLGVGGVEGNEYVGGLNGIILGVFNKFEKVGGVDLKASAMSEVGETETGDGFEIGEIGT